MAAEARRGRPEGLPQNVTTDSAPSAHFEHTVLTTERGPEILTVPPAAR